MNVYSITFTFFLLVLTPTYAIENHKESECQTKALSQGMLLLSQGRMAANTESWADAENYFLEALNYELPEQQRKDILLELAIIFEKMGKSSKITIIYEKYLKRFPNDSNYPQILIQLGRLYRDMGAYNRAIDRFYSVLNLSFKIKPSELPLFRHLTTKAQLEIADTYFIMEEYEKALSFFERLELLKLNDIERMRIDFKQAYSYYKLESFEKGIPALSHFLQEYPESTYAPEGRFMLANAYKQNKQLIFATNEVIQLLKHIDPEDHKEEQNWSFWKKKTANQLANDFYELKDFYSALRIYQAMAPLNNSPNWQWPIIYQIGRCFERLNRLDKAKDAYTLIASNEQWNNQKFTITEALQTIKKTAKWRLEHLAWLKNNQAKIKDITKLDNKSLKSQK